MIEEIYKSITAPILSYLAKAPLFIEKTVIFLVIIILGYIIGRVLGTLIRIILTRFLSIDDLLKNAKLENALYGYSLSDVISTLTRWYIYIYFIAIGLETFGYSLVPFVLVTLNTLYKSIALFVFGLYLAEFVKNAIERTTIKEKELIKNAIKYIIIYIFFVLALQYFGVDAQIFLDLLRYFALAAAISFGITFGVFLLIKHKEEIEKLFK